MLHGYFPKHTISTTIAVVTDIENLISQALGIPWSNKKCYVLDRTIRQKLPQARKRSNNILHSNSSPETNLTLVLENATITDTRPTPITSKQNITTKFIH